MNTKLMLTTHFKPASLKTVLGLLVLCISASAFSAEEKPPVSSEKVERLGLPTLPTDKAPFSDTLESKETGVNIKTYNFPLMDFMPHPKPIVLRKANDQHALYFPVSNRIDVTYAELRLKFTNSISLLQDRSQLRIKLNDITVAQLPLRADQPQVDVVVELPAELITSGFNNLTIWVAQHYTLECEDPAAPELWTEIDTFNSELKLTGQLQPIDIMLSELDQVMGPAIGNPQSYRILMPEQFDENHVATGALIAESIGLRHFYRSPLFMSGTAQTAPVADFDSTISNEFSGLDQATLSGSDNVLFGTRDELKPYLSSDVLSEIKDAFIGIFPLPSDPKYFVLVVSGTTKEELKRAATALNFSNFPYTDSKTSLIKATDIPANSRFGRKQFIKTDRLYTLEELGLETSTVQGSGYHEFDLIFELPADFYAAEDATVNLKLDFSYGARMRDDSILNVKLNNAFERVIALRDPNGAVFKGYEITIPLRAFNPGRNQIRFEPALIPSVGGECIAVNDRNLQFTLYGSSIIKFPFATTYVGLPDLNLFSNTVFPYRRHGQAEPMTVSVLSNDHDTIAATWTLMAKFAQVADGPVMNAEFLYSLPADDREIIVVSPFDKLDEEMMKAAPIQLNGSGSYSYPVSETLEGQKVETGFLAQLPNLFGNKKEEPETLPLKARIKQNINPQAHGVAMAFQSPYSKERSITVFTAETGEKLHRYMEAIVQPNLWSKLSGDVALWTDESKSVNTQSIGKKFYIGDAGLRDKTRYQISDNPWWWIIGVFLLIFLLAWITRALLHRRFVNRHGRNVRIED